VQGVRFLLRPQKVTVATPEGEKHVEVSTAMHAMHATHATHATHAVAH
jgi:hypothetical protein